MGSSGRCDPAASTSGVAVDAADVHDGASSPVSCGDTPGDTPTDTASGDTLGDGGVGAAPTGAVAVAAAGAAAGAACTGAVALAGAAAEVGRWARAEEELRRPREDAAKRARLPMRREEAAAVESDGSGAGDGDASVSSSSTVPTACGRSTSAPTVRHRVLPGCARPQHADARLGKGAAV